MIKEVQVWGHAHEVTIRQQSKSVWIASGEYMGEYHSAQGRSPATAAAQWREWAQHKGK